jgi:hypothetical protein
MIVPNAEAETPPGYEIVQLTKGPEYERWPRINNCGQIVFSKVVDQSGTLVTEIFLYDNGQVNRITDNSVADAHPDVNDAGTIVWTHEADGFGGGTVARYENGTITLLAPGFTPVINNLGHVAWIRYNDQGCWDVDAAVFFYDRQTIQQITDYSTSNQGVSINDLDDLVWTRYDFCVNPWESDVMLYRGEVTTPLTTGEIEPRGPDLNNLGIAAWGGPEGIRLWKARAPATFAEQDPTLTLTDWGRNPHLNDVSDVSFLRWHDDSNTWQVWLYRGGLGGAFFQLTNPPLSNTASDINDAGEVVMKLGVFPAGDIALLRRIRTGEYDFDGDIDLDDYAAFEACMTGPGPVDGLCQCRFLDIDHDRDVDLADFAELQQAFTGQ